MFINNCMGCKKHIETLSLRAEVKRFETGVEYQRLEKMLQKKTKRLKGAMTQSPGAIILLNS